MSRMTPREITALHEAGHVAAFRQIGDRLHHVALYDPPRSRDRRRISGETYRVAASDTHPVNDALRNLAGVASEYRATGAFDPRGGVTDVRLATDCAAKAGLTLADLWPDALALIEQHRDNIETVAGALLRRGRLSGEQMEALVVGGWVSPRWAAN